MSDSMRQVEVLRAACCVAGVDGHSSESEQRLLKRLAAQAGVGSASLSAMIECAESDPQFFQDQFRVLKAEPKKTMQILFRVAVADGDLSEQEVTVLQRLGERLDVTGARFESWHRQAVRYIKKKAAEGEG